MSNCDALHLGPLGQPRRQSGRPGAPQSASGKSSSAHRTRGNRRNPLSGIRLHPASAPGWGLIALAALLLQPGCAAPPPRPSPQPAREPAHGPSTAGARADWDDIEASVTAALSKTELVFVRLTAPEPGRLVYTLRTSRDEPASLTVERLDPPGVQDPVGLSLTCTVGRFGDPAREREFLDLVIKRLRQLRDVEVAPLTD